MVAKPSAICGALADLEPAESELREAISRCKEIPVGVQNAAFTYVSTRIFDQASYNEIVSQSPQGPDWPARIDLRKQNLREKLGCQLTCVFVRLPGVHYTIEVDPDNGSVVHWEWQSA